MSDIRIDLLTGRPYRATNPTGSTKPIAGRACLCGHNHPRPHGQPQPYCAACPCEQYRPKEVPDA